MYLLKIFPLSSPKAKIPITDNDMDIALTQRHSNLPQHCPLGACMLMSLSSPILSFILSSCTVSFAFK